MQIADKVNGEAGKGEKKEDENETVIILVFMQRDRQEAVKKEN